MGTDARVIVEQDGQGPWRRRIEVCVHCVLMRPRLDVFFYQRMVLNNCIPAQ